MFRGAAADGRANTRELYDVLGVKRDASAADIKKAFRNLAKTHHPDKGGDPERFKELSKAHEILTDDEKRKLYDQYGMDGVEGGAPSAADMDPFSMFFGDRGNRPAGKRRGDDVVFPMPVTLEELYCGMSKKLRLTKSIICRDCEGRGGKPGAEVQCRNCKGQGVRIMLRQLGPGVVQQIQSQCDFCHGEGRVISDRDKCRTCHGARVVKDKKTLEVFVNKGMSHGTRIPFRGEGDEAPNTIPGDVIVVLQQKDHPLFKRDGPNLFVKKTITLQEALCGFSVRIPHLDGRILAISSDEKQTYTPGCYKVVREEGMPILHSPMQRGSLYIEFEVEFPKAHQLNKQSKDLLRRILPGPIAQPNAHTLGAQNTPSVNMDGQGSAGVAPMDTQGGSTGPSTPEPNVEEVRMEDVDIAAERARFAEQRRQAKESAAYDDDEEDMGRGPATGCRAQ